DGGQSEVIREDSKSWRERLWVSTCRLYFRHRTCERGQHQCVDVSECSIRNVFPVDFNCAQTVEWRNVERCGGRDNIVAEGAQRLDRVGEYSRRLRVSPRVVGHAHPEHLLLARLKCRTIEVLASLRIRKGAHQNEGVLHRSGHDAWVRVPLNR